MGRVFGLDVLVLEMPKYIEIVDNVHSLCKP